MFGKKPYPLDTRCKLNVHKAFKRRPGRLLKVLCTFNLRPVSRGSFPLFIYARPSGTHIFYSQATLMSNNRLAIPLHWMLSLVATLRQNAKT